MRKLRVIIVLSLISCLMSCSSKSDKNSVTSTSVPDPMPIDPTDPIPAPPISSLPDSNGNLFTKSVPWNKDISASAVDSQSSTIINWLSNNGGWGNGKMQVDFSFHILTKTATTPMVAVTKKSGYYSPDCDNLSTFPLPKNGAIEGVSGYTCSGADCHLLVVDIAGRKLYESFESNVVNGKLQSTCVVAWDLDKAYGPKLRGDQCTSTDAAGLPITPLLFTADEVAAGEIKHAIRFILPNARMKAGVFVRPATHAGAPSGPANAVPYGARFRLKASYNISKLKPAAQVVAKAMKKYGMILADGGNIALTAETDDFTTAKWSALGFGSQDLSSLKVTDFEMIDAGTRIKLTYDCVREP